LRRTREKLNLFHNAPKKQNKHLSHVHADHVTGTSKLREIFAGKKEKTVPRSVISKPAKAQAEVVFEPDSDAIVFGRFALRPLATPGHTKGCCSFYLAPDEVAVAVAAAGEEGEGKQQQKTTTTVRRSPGMVFSGDALLIRGCGRTDFQGGSSQELFHSVREKLFRLPDDTVVYPAHDYKGMTSSTIGEEKEFNPRLGVEKTEEEFVEIMGSLDLPKPKKIDEAVPLNLKCGV
jgi:sulfur dioxygenase